MKRLEKGWVLVLMGVWLVFAGQSAWSADVHVGQVVVTATKTEVEISDVPQATSVITREEIMNTPDRSVAEVIQRAAGVEVTQYGPVGAVALPKIRGSESGQVLILLNGRRINDAQSGQFDLNNLPVSKEDIERIEILRGAASALYGADALGGVINIITKTPSKVPYTRASASYGRFGTQEYSLFHQWKLGPLAYGVSLSKEQSRGFRENSDADKWTVGGEVGYEITPKSEVKLAARMIQKEIGVPGPVTWPDPDDRQKDQNTLLDFSYQGKITSRLALNFKGFHNNYRRTFDPGTRGFNTGSPFLHKNYASGGELQTTYAWGDAHLLTGGAEFIHDRVNSSAIGVHEADRGAIYLQDEIELAKPLTATIGIRYDSHSIYKDQLNPRVGTVLRLPGDTRLRASVGRSFRAPTFDDLFWPEDAWVAGNPNLQPEKAWSYELGGEKKIGELAFFKAAGFYRRVEDLIIWQMGSDWKFRPNNVKTAEIWGVETEIVFYPFQGLNIPINYTYLYPRDTSTGEPIALKPKHMVNVGFEYATTFGLKTSLKGRYVQYYVNERTTLNRDYFVADAKVSYELKVYQNMKGEAFLSLTNILDRDYQINEGYPMPPRSLSGGVSFAF
ncbi:MAG: TonB-dependent receptor [Thermodesulfobacteriota bacterium]|nr:TonB-dependent receptor [Thermodesulfobacteriota bacterium]